MNQYDHIRKNLKDYKVTVDKDKLWANTADAIPRKRKKRGAFLLLLAGAVMLGTSITFFALAPTQISTSEKIDHSVSSTLPTVKVDKENTSTLSRPSSISGNTNATEADGSITTTSNKPDDDHSSNLYNPTITDAVTNIKTGAQEISNSSDQNTTTLSSSAPPEIAGYNNTHNELTDHYSADDSQTSNGPVEIMAPNADIADLTRNDPYNTEALDALPVTMLAIPPGHYIPGNVPVIKVKNKNGLNLLLMQSYGWSTLEMSTNADELQSTIREWDGKIKSLENLSTTLQAAIRLPKGIQVGGGLQYSRLTTQMEYQQMANEDFIQQGITAIIIGEDGNQQNLYGDVPVHRQTITNVTRFAYHDRLDLEAILSLPLYRSYRTETGVWVKAGYTLLYTSQGTTFGPGDAIIKYATEDNPYTLESPFTFGAGIAACYRITPQWTLNARFGYERLRYTHGLYDDLISFHQHILSLSLGAGYVIK